MVAKQKCVAMVFAVCGKFIYDKQLSNKQTLVIETLGGIRILYLQVKSGKVIAATVDMGEPIFDIEKIPVICENEVKGEFPLMTITALDKTFDFHFVSVGNPHAMTIVENVKDFPVQIYGPILEIDKHFPNKSNIEFIELVDRNHIKMRVWERGSGETMACGTAATACVAACAKSNLIDRKAQVELLGGVLEFEWKTDNHIYMTGPATKVFEGEFKEKE